MDQWDEKPHRRARGELSVSEDANSPNGVLREEYAYIYPIMNFTSQKSRGPSGRVSVCIYRINTSNSHYNVSVPFLQYLLYKYPKTAGPHSDLCIFPVAAAKGKDPQKEARNLAERLVGPNIEERGCLWVKRVGLFYFYQANPKSHNKMHIRTLSRKNELWWGLIDELCNYKRIMNFPVHPSVYTLFYRNPGLLYLHKKNGDVFDVPQVGFFGGYYETMPVVAAFGQRIKPFQRAPGPYYYFGTFRKAVRYAGWTPWYGPMVSEGRELTDAAGKYTDGGIVRFALFLGGMRVLVKEPKQGLEEFLDEGAVAAYVRKYKPSPKVGHQGLYLAQPEYALKNYNRRIALSIHHLDMTTLKKYWKPDYAGYNIK